MSTAEVGDKPPPGLVAWQQDMVAVLDPVIEDTTLIGLVGRLADTLVLADHLGLRAESMDSRALTDTANLSTVLFAAHQLQVDLAGTEMRRVALGNANKQSWALPRTWRYAGPELTSVVLRHRDSRLNTSERLRYQTATRLAARPQHREAKQRQRGVPLTIWPDWAIRLTPPTGSQHNRYTMVLAVAICLAGTSQSINGVVGAWPWDHRFDFEIARGLHSIGRNSDATTTIEALTLLAAHLDRHGSPIDYTRRNHLAASTELIDGDSWDGICRASATPTGAATKLQAARLWIWETITGGQPYQAPQHLRPTTVQLTQYRHFELRLPDDAAHLLDQHTRALLDSHGCEDEPLSWTPQLDSIDLSRLPGPDPSSVNPADVHRLLHKRHTREVVAQQLGISREHLRCIIRRHPPQLRPRSTGKRPVLRHPIPAHLTGPKLRSLIENGHSITGIAAANGLTRQNIRNELIRHGIAIPTPGRLQQSRIDPEWLRHQYLVELRVLSDIAAETGKSVTTIARLAETHGIPLRHRGSQSHQTSLRVNNDYPNPLAVAVLGQSGVERVRHFQIYATMRSLHAASCHTGKHLSSLLSQLRQLETACGGQLIASAPRQQRAQQLTPLGHELLRQADKHLGPNPDALPKLPAPLATAMNAFWGSGRLERFLITATSQTVNDAAQRIGAHADSLSISIRGLGEVVGGPLLVRAPPSAPLRLTPLGRKLSRQANLHADDLKRWGLSIPVAEAEAAPQK